MAGTRLARATLTGPVRLVNLTEHEVLLRAQSPGPGGADLKEAGGPRPIPAAGQVARVDDDAARLSGGWADIPAGRSR
jgi:hypothetical protein